MSPRYECDCCGACCQGALIVEAFHLDALREPAILDADIGGRQATIEELAEDDGRCVLLAAGQACRFLASDGRCTIYPTRPNVCVGMEAGDEQCQDARQRTGLPPLEPVRPAEHQSQPAHHL